MKKLLFVAVMAFGMLNASAQLKIGYINTEELISLMPEAAKAEIEIRDYQNSLKLMGQTLEIDATKKRDQYFLDSLKLTPSMKEVRTEELVKLYTRLENYATEVQQKTNEYYQNKIAPIQNKALEQIKLIAKEKGFTYVIDLASSALLVMPPGDDLMPLVKAKLGIKDPPPPAK